MPSLPPVGLHEDLAVHALLTIHDVLRRTATNITVPATPDQPAPLHLGMHDLRPLALSSGLGNARSVNASAILQVEQRHTIQVIATATASVSITAVFCALYWFGMMRRNFRRDLILLLIIGDFWKSLWYLTYSLYTFVHGPIKTGSKLCFSSGYMLQTGVEACDVAILLMSLHMHLQIFPPRNSFLGHDGLYRVRYWVVAAWFLLPNLSAGLAFADGSMPAYMTTGAWCTLPIRPFWYRLALSWVPRYLIWIFVMGVAIRIYRHVGKEFQVFGHAQDDSSSMNMPGESSVARAEAHDLTSSEAGRSKLIAPATDAEEFSGTVEDDVAPDDTSASNTKSVSMSKESPKESNNTLPYNTARRQSMPNRNTAISQPVEALTGPSSRSEAESRRGSRVIVAGIFAEDFAPWTAQGSQGYDASRHRGSVTTMSSMKSSGTQSFDGAAALPAIEETRTSMSIKSNRPENVAALLVDIRRRAIQRQLRLLFIYPVIYMMLWIVPFVSHCMSYSDYYAQHPIFVISAISTFCQCFLGFADVCVFCWREKPWRHVPGTDATFLGSFGFWRVWWLSERRGGVRRASLALRISAAPETKVGEKGQSQKSGLASLRPWSNSRKDSSSKPSRASVTAPLRGLKPSVVHRRIHSGGSDRRQLDAEAAHERLALERADWEQNRRSLEARRASVMSMQHAPSRSLARERKEWWDHHMENDMFDDKDHEENATGDA